ncbi:MAG TPA: Ppx/GppA phosphatase family protein [Actinomycetota bacterium]|nr:Ppx/GppA phosphatase family protein [Actinomycetota bacterium]
MRLAVLDLGSTTFQLLVADADEEGSLAPVIRDRVVLNLGMALGPGGIAPELAARAAETVLRFRTVAERSGVDGLVAIGTSALRDAPNRAELDAVLGPAAGAPIRYIDGREEARLMFAGIRSSVALGPGATLFLDLGGGSLEVALANGELRWGESVPVGAGRLTAQLMGSDPPTRSERKAVRETVTDALEHLVEPVRREAPVRCVASGGTAGALARVLAARRWATPPDSLNGFELAVRQIRDLSRELAALTLRDRLKIPGIDDRRANLLPAGAIILSTAAASLGAETLVHSEWGLREGVVLDELGLAGGSAPEPAALRRRSVDRLVQTWAEDRPHVELIARLALDLFDDLRAMHAMGEGERELLEHAALLHDVGVRVSPDRIHKHGAYLVEHAGLRGFSPEEIAIIASLVRFQKGRPPRPVYAPYAGLPSKVKERVRALAGILRVAHALGRGGEDDVRRLRVRISPNEVRVRLTGTSNPEGAAAEAQIQSELLAAALGVDLRFEGRTFERANA